MVIEYVEGDENRVRWNYGNTWYYADLDDLIRAYESIRHGRWMHDKDDELITGYCSKCGWTSIIYETDVADMPFCPNCGARMSEVKDGENN